MRLGVWVPDTSCCFPCITLPVYVYQSLHLWTQSAQAERTPGTWGGGSQGLRIPSELTRVSGDALSLEMACLPEIILPSLIVGSTLWDHVAADCRINLLV